MIRCDLFFFSWLNQFTMCEKGERNVVIATIRVEYCNRLFEKNVILLFKSILMRCCKKLFEKNITLLLKSIFSYVK